MTEGTRQVRAGDSPESIAALHAKLDAVREDVAEIKETSLPEIKDTAREIKAAQLVTNGRVTQLELWQARWQGAKWALAWLPPVFTGLLSGVGVVLVAYLIDKS